MTDNTKDIKLTREELEQATRYLKEIATLRGVSVKELRLSREDIKMMAREVVDGTYKKDKELIKDVTTLMKESLREQKQLRQEQLKKSQSTWGKINTWLNDTGGKEDLASQYRARQVAGGLETAFSGNILSGIRQIGSAFPRIATFMGGPYYLALSLTVRSLLKFDDALAKATKSASDLTGGLNSAYLNRSGLSAAAFNRSLKGGLYDLGMQKEYENISNALQKGYGMGSYQGRQSEFINSMAYAQKGLGSLGISADTANTLLTNLRAIEGKETTGIYAQLNRLTKNISAMKYFSPEQAMQQMSSLFDQTKMLGTNFEWANKMITKFEAELKKGTISLSDFAAVNKSLRSGSLSQNAGLGALITDYASRAGINLPENFVNSNALGQGFALTTENMLSNKNILAAYQGQLAEMVQQMGGSNKFEQAGALQAILQSRGINVSAEAAEAAIKKDGTIDLEGAGIIGRKAFQTKKDEEQAAKKYQEQVRKYYTASTSWHSQVLTDLGKIVNNTTGFFEKKFGAMNDLQTSFQNNDVVGMFKSFQDFAPNISNKLLNIFANKLIDSIKQQ